jgi:hypothetical protein
LRPFGAPAERRYDHAIALLVWISLAFLVLAVTAPTVVLFVHARATWRTLRGFSEATSGAMAAVERSAAAAEARAASLSGGSAHLEAAIGRLEQSLSQLAVLRGALDEVRASVGGLRGTVPRK